MTEIFTNIPEEVKEQTKLIVNFIFKQLDVESGLKFIEFYIYS